MLASLDHPNILPIYEVGQGEDGLPFFSMKYAIGGSLQKAGATLRNNPRECVRLMAKVARAVQHGIALAKADRLSIQFSRLEVYRFGPEAGVKRRRRRSAVTSPLSLGRSDARVVGV